ncbi:hypothetical protein [Streptomyces sp. NPDC127100]|uniref:hypothetical protein n=1 Tax=Streptomyces sp. NPDC127100 TaxID=3347138 RepID=UPI00365E4B8E
MPKESRARTRAIRAAQGENREKRYTQASHTLDGCVSASQTAADPTAPAMELHVVPFVFSCTVPATLDRHALAQALADQLHTLRRKKTSEEYEGRADIVVLPQDWEPEPQLPGHVSAMLLVNAWAVRPWARAGEWEAVVTDFYDAGKAWVLEQYPVPVGGHPVAMPLDTERALALYNAAGVVAHTGGEHAEMPASWAPLVAARRAELAAAVREPHEEAVGQNLPEMVPNARGGDAKTSSSSRRPYRVVDRFYQGWYLRSGDGTFDADGGHRRGLETLDFATLERTRGPLRPVVPPTDEDCAAVKAALVGAGRRAAGSLLVALYRLVLEDAGAGREGGARYRVMAGREGSWESEDMVRLAWNVGADLAEKKSRFDEAAVAVLVRVVQGWVAGPDVYVEVASNLAGLFSAVADETGGWPAVADRPLQPGQRVGGHPEHVVEAVQHYLLSQTADGPA